MLAALWSQLFGLLHSRPVKAITSHERGRRAEALAAEWLIRQGYRIAARNVRTPVGELDLIAHQGGALCFIEVRSRGVGSFGLAAETVTERKRRRIDRAARWWLQRHRRGWRGPVRFDVVAIDEDRAGGAPRCRLITNAFESGW